MAILLIITLVNIGIVLSFWLSVPTLGLNGNLLAVAILECALVALAILHAKQASPGTVRAVN